MKDNGLRVREGTIGPQTEIIEQSGERILLLEGGHQYEIVEDFYKTSWQDLIAPLNEKYKTGIKLE